MKKMIIMVICLVLALSMVGCGKTTLKIGEESDTVEGTAFDVSMDIVEGTIQTTGLTLRVTNNTDIEIDSGNAFDFAIEAKIDNKWYTMEADERDNTAEAMIFEGVRDVEISWSQIYGALPKGQYRVVKCFWPWTEDGTYGVEDGFCLTSEFSIK